jgi:hypothetical protein
LTDSVTAQGRDNIESLFEGRQPMHRHVYSLAVKFVFKNNETRLELSSLLSVDPALKVSINLLGREGSTIVIIRHIPII